MSDVAAVLLFKEVFVEHGTSIIQKCAACGCYTGEIPAEGRPGVSHGYCEPCGKVAQEEVRRYLDQNRAPSSRERSSV